MLGHRTLNAEDYFAILKRRWWIICIPAVIMPVIAVLLTYVVTPKYDSISLLLIEQQKVSSDVVKPMDIGDLQSSLGLITARIESNATLEPIITKYNLYANQHLPMEARIALVKKNLQFPPIQTAIDRGNGLPGFKVVFTADDPRTAQEVCAEITGLFTQNSLLQQQTVTAGTKDFLQSALNEEKRKLDDMDQKLAEFKSKNLGALPGDEGNTVNYLNSLSSRLDATSQQINGLQESKQLKQVQLNQLTSIAAPAVVSARMQQTGQTDLEKAQADLAQLQTEYKDDYPEVKAAKRRVADLQAQVAKAAAAPPASVAAPAPRVDTPEVAELKTVIKLIDQEIASKTKEQAQIQAQMQNYQGRLQMSPAVDQQYIELTRDYTTEQNIYNGLLAKMGQSQMSTDLENQQRGESFTVLDPASLPTDPTFPKASIFVFGGLAVGIGLGVLIVALLDYRDTALRTERDVWAFTQLPTLAVIAYSGNVADDQSAKPNLLKRLFQRKRPKELLAG